MKTLPIIAAILFATSASAAVTGNANSCDIGVTPAATLLLPYFEVDFYGNSGRTTLFTVTNVSQYPQIAHVTLWTDLAFPVVNFNLYLNGYGVQSINLADVIGRGVIAAHGADLTRGPLSYPASISNLRTASDCGAPATITGQVAAVLRTTLTTGVYNPGGGIAPCTGLGTIHVNAIGYATIDVVSNCTSRFPNDPLYYTNDLLFDNVLIGDYEQVGVRSADPSFFDPRTIKTSEAGGNPMVHIRAVPEGGPAGAVVKTPLPYTFYDRYTPSQNRIADRRQPLPSTFAARYIEGGTGAYATNFTIWREGIEARGCASCCASYFPNAALVVEEVVRFDEHENASVFYTLPCGPPGGCQQKTAELPSTSSYPTNSYSFYPPLFGTDVGGWIYLDLNNGGSASYSVTRDVGGEPVIVTGPGSTSKLAPPGSSVTIGPRPSQNWVTVTLIGNVGNSLLSTEFDAVPLGNACSPSAAQSTANTGRVPIGPAGGALVCPPGTRLTNDTTTACTGTNVNPLP